MGLACAQIRLLSLTERKADCEFGISIKSMEKMALSREMTELSQEYYSRLQAKEISYYANGQYNAINYSYLMGPGVNCLAVAQGTTPLKDNNSMILTDYKGQVVLSEDYANAIIKVLGNSAMDAEGRGAGFSLDYVPEIIAAMTGFPVEADAIKKVMDNEKVPQKYAASVIKTLSGEDTNKDTTVDNTEKATELIKKLLDLYLPIFRAAATNGWTTEYNKDMGLNEDYISDALISGSFQLATVNDYGDYGEDDCLTYFLTAGLVQERNDSSAREEVTAWHNAERDRTTEKETLIDLEIEELSAELEMINTEIQSVKSLIDDATSSVFDWGNG